MLFHVPGCSRFSGNTRGTGNNLRNGCCARRDSWATCRREAAELPLETCTKGPHGRPQMPGSVHGRRTRLVRMHPPTFAGRTHGTVSPKWCLATDVRGMRERPPTARVAAVAIQLPLALVRNAGLWGILFRSETALACRSLDEICARDTAIAFWKEGPACAPHEGPLCQTPRGISSVETTRGLSSHKSARPQSVPRHGVPSDDYRLGTT
jgi:hypothetical protein